MMASAPRASGFGAVLAPHGWAGAFGLLGSISYQRQLPTSSCLCRTSTNGNARSAAIVNAAR